MITRASSSGGLNIDELVYRGEGNNTIVLSDHTSGVIFRFRKTSWSSSEEDERQKLKVPKCLSESYSFRYHVLRHCLGDEFVASMQLLEVPSDLLKRLDERLKPERPTCRLQKSIDTAYRNVLRAPDACKLPPTYRPYGTGPIVCVEVKTKNGFIPTSYSVHNHLERTVCKFCMVQYHEKKTKLYNSRSSYCPCDLFSGRRPRMRRALKALLRDPQINFRCFLDGRLHYSCNHELKSFFEFLHSFLEGESENESVEDFLDLLIDGLLFEFGKSQSISWIEGTNYSLRCHEGIRNAYLDNEILIDDGMDSKTQLSLDCVLGRIFNVQLRNSIGICGIQTHFSRLSKHFEAISMNWQWSERFVEISCMENTCSRRWPSQSETDYENRLRDWNIDSKELLDSFRFVEDYLIALVANDCSLMLTMQEAKPNAPPHLPIICTRQGKRLLLNAVVVDLDPKPFVKVSESGVKWNQEIIDYYEANRPSMPESLAKTFNLSSDKDEASISVNSSPSYSSSHSNSSTSPRLSPDSTLSSSHRTSHTL